MQSKSWDIDEVNSVDFSKLEIGSINASVAQSIGITDATDFFQVIRIPWDSPYPNQILLTLSGKQRMYYRACSNGTWETPKQLLTNADLNKIGIQSLAFLLQEDYTDDILSLSSQPGIYSVIPEAENNPTVNYGLLCIIKAENNNWRFVLFIPTDLSKLYINFYNAYGSIGWGGWKHIDFTS